MPYRRVFLGVLHESCTEERAGQPSGPEPDLGLFRKPLRILYFQVL